MAAPAPTRKAHPVATPAPTGFWRRQRYSKAHTHVTVGEAWFHATRVALYFAKTFLVTKLWPAAWRNKDRTCLATLPVLFLFVGFWWTLLAVPLAVLGASRFHGRARKTRLVTKANRRMGKATVYSPKVVNVEQCPAPALLPRIHGDHVKLGPIEVTSPKVGQLLDRVTAIIDRPEIVSEYQTLKIPPGVNPDDFSNMERTLGAIYERAVKLDPHPLNPALCTMRLQHVDFLARQVPWTRMDNLTPYRLPVGMDWDARWRFDSITDQAWLVAGQRGSGKTAFLRGLCGRLFEMPGVELYLADHLKDLEDFEHDAKEYTNTEEGALDMLERFVGLHAKAYLKIGRNLKALRWPDHVVRVLVIDELGALTTHPDRKVQERVEQALYVLATQGRKTQHSLLCATQHPSAAIIPTRVRTSFTRRLGLKLGETAESRMLFNMEHPPNCTAISEAHKGRAWYSQDGRLMQLRTPGLYDDDLSWLVGDGIPPGNHGRSWDSDPADDETSAGFPGKTPPPTPLMLVPDLVETTLSDEDRLWLVLEKAPPTGYTRQDLVRLTGIKRSTLYRWMAPGRLGWVQTVQNVQPKRYRLAPGVRRSA